MFNPVSTYRLQFNKTFTFKDADVLLPYLGKAGIKTIYASPVLQAVKGSTHGYDVTDPLTVNPEIGTSLGFEQLLEKVHTHGMGWIQDIVPNHMAYSPENPWICDVLEKGKYSEYYEFFDIIQEHSDPVLKNKLMLPFFGKHIDQLISDRELKVVFNKNGISLKYFDSEYPVSVPAYALILEAGSDAPVPETVAAFLNDNRSAHEFDERKKKLAAAFENSLQVRDYITSCLEIANTGTEKLTQIVDKLYYYPAFWRDTETRINYRRFFTINGLISLNIQNKKVFDTCHQLISEWISNKLVDGLRVDHIDGLYNPAQYLDRLRQLAGEHVPIYVEKILEEEESLPGHWPIQGTTGYDFLSLVNNLLTNRDTGPVFHSFYCDWIQKKVEYDNVFYSKNRFILYKRLAGDLDNLTHKCLSMESVQKRGYNQQTIRAAIGEFLVACPVYKVYHSPTQFREHDVEMIKTIGETAMKKNPEIKNAIKMLVDLFLLNLPGSRNETGKADHFFRRCMQFAGPLMAKGIEDTAFYSYNPFIGHNEVGDSPGYFGISAEQFHHAMEERHKNLPLSLNATATHDTKRGEDARARLNVLSDMPVKWMEEARRWRNMNKKYKKQIEDREIPSPNDEYLIYQVLCAHLPMNAKAGDAFLKRLQDYLIKAMREAKENSSWSNPDEEYENEVISFIHKIFSPGSAFPARLAEFMEELIPHGIVNSLTQLILKNTAPGVPDTYQGTETWNLSFVDPDNRQPVDFLTFSENIRDLESAWNNNPAELAETLFSDPGSGKLKQWITWITLKERLANPELFLKGVYIPLKVIGKYHKRVIAFSRSLGNQQIIVILPLSTATLEGDFLWDDTQVKLPDPVPRNIENILTGASIEPKRTIQLVDVFEIIPFAVLRCSS